MSYIKEKYNKEIKRTMIAKYKYKNMMQVPKVLKVVINRGLGEALTNAGVIEQTVNEMQRLTGQKPVLMKAKKSISNFKVRQGNIIGCKVTLRSDKMYDFLTKFINIGLPKIKDFRGVNNNSFDGRGNYTIGIREGIIFPEVVYDRVDRIRGYDITIVTSAKTDEEAYELLIKIGMPFRKK